MEDHDILPPDAVCYTPCHSQHAEHYTAYPRKEAIVQLMVAVILVDKAITTATASPGSTATTSCSCQNQALQLRRFFFFYISQDAAQGHKKR